MASSALKKFDHPIVFSLAITLVVLGWMAVLSWGFRSMGWTGPLGVTKGGVD